LIIPLTVQWWSVWYPGSEPGGGSYVAQRMLASRSEKDAVAGTLLFNAAHYALRPWPWIIVALASLLVYPTLDDIARALPHVDRSLIGHDMAYPAMLRFLPPGMLGLMIAGLLAAYVSTISTHLNWGTSYIVHDLYRRFLKPGSSEAHYVLVGRLVTAGLMVVAALLTFVLETAQTSFNLLLSIGAGTGLLYLLRWFWWRINAWSEVAAMASSFVVALALFLAGRQGSAPAAHVALLLSIAITTVVWVSVTFLTRPTDAAVLRSFYERVRPGGPGWHPVARSAGLPASRESLATPLWASLLGCFAIYGALFGSGALLYGRTAQGIAFLGVALITSVGIARLLPRILSPDRGGD
jgi:SSS family solute:Na+ symporter